MIRRVIALLSLVENKNKHNTQLGPSPTNPATGSFLELMRSAIVKHAELVESPGPARTANMLAAAGI